MTGFLPTDQAQGFERVYRPDAASLVLDPQVVCRDSRVGDERPLSDACYSTCFAQCLTRPRWTETRS